MSKKLKDSLIQLMLYIREGLETLNSMELEEKMELLQQMQAAVIYIGNTIEQVQQNTEKIIACLTEFAEHIYELSIEAVAVENVIVECDDLSEVLQANVEAKYEVLFLPYKSSMWDSLESIYQAALLDNTCNVMVMPIPYYSVSADREHLEENYEGNDFPSDIAIVDYREYSIEEKMPDVIFVHNPYDDANRVTQVKPCYFSSELVKHTDRLVYVPYKVCSGKVKDEYCVLPGVKNAWRVFVQSESVREVYVKYQPEEKIIVTGSPKIDKVIASMVNKRNLPKTWEPAFEGKKVFLLNTHLKNIMGSPYQMLDAMGELLNLFKGREDIALLWRPHPLSIQTIKATKPEILEAYQELIEECKKLDNAIYDETPEPHLAIAISDAYIGDWSSLVSMYGVTGKPIYIRNMDHKKAEVDEETFYESKKLKSIYYEQILSLDKYIELVRNEQDVRNTLRKSEFEKIFYRIDGYSGKNIWEYVKADFEETL